jgi:hypothetical protein
MAQQTQRRKQMKTIVLAGLVACFVACDGGISSSNTPNTDSSGMVNNVASDAEVGHDSDGGHDPEHFGKDTGSVSNDAGVAGCLNGETRACTSQCGSGQQSCIGGVWGACSAAQPAAEICNGIDDDCNGTVDDGATCESGKVCKAGACVTNAAPPTVQPKVCPFTVYVPVAVVPFVTQGWFSGAKTLTFPADSTSFKAMITAVVVNDNNPSIKVNGAPALILVELPDLKTHTLPLAVDISPHLQGGANAITGTFYNRYGTEGGVQIYITGQYSSVAGCSGPFVTM